MSNKQEISMPVAYRELQVQYEMLKRRNLQLAQELADSKQSVETVTSDESEGGEDGASS